MDNLVFVPQWFSISTFGSRIVVSVVLFVIGLIAARRVTKFLRHQAKILAGSQWVKGSPFEVFIDSITSLRGTGLLSTVLYWFVVLFFVAIIGEVMGILLLSEILAMIVSTIPAVFAAVVVFLVGVLLAGILEKVVKQQMKRVMPQQSVIAGTLTSYTVLGLFSLMALSEIGIASLFIELLFAGIVFAIALGLGLAFGLGSKDLVRDMLTSMVEQEQESRHEKKAKK